VIPSNDHEGIRMGHQPIRHSSDRVVLYLWPRAGGVKFSFTFKPRFGMKALTTPSVLYDYYNPEARAWWNRRSLWCNSQTTR